MSNRSDSNLPNSAEEVLARYQSGERHFDNLELDVHDDFHNSQGADLTGIDFRGSFLFADFRGACLRRANFDHCNVKTCDFRGADLREATFCHAALDGAEFNGALMSEANFEGATWASYSMQAGEMPD